MTLRNRILGGLEIVAGVVVMHEGQKYGLSPLSEVLGVYFILEGGLDLSNGESFYLTKNVLPQIFKYFKNKDKE